MELLQELVDVGIALAGERDIGVLLEAIVRHARHFTGAERGLVLILEAERLHPAILQDDDETILDPPLMPEEVERLTMDASRTPVSTGSTLIAPLLERTGEALGWLVLMNGRNPDGRRVPFDAEDEALTSTLAAHAAAALHNARAYAGVVRHADRLTALSRLTRLMTSAHDSSEVFVAIAEAATTLLGAVWARVWATDPVERVVRAEATFGVDRTIDAVMTDHVITYGQGIIGRIVEDGTPAYIANVATDARLLNRRLATVGGVRGFAALPLIAGSRVVGVLGVFFREERNFGTEDRQLMELLAGHAAIALENTRSYGEARERLRTTETLLAVAQALSRAAPVPEMLRRVGRELAHAIGADAVGAYFLDPQKKALLPVAGYRIHKALLPIYRGMPLTLERWAGIRDAMREQRTMSSADAGNDPRCDRDALASEPPHSMLFAPTVARGEAVGGLYVLWWKTGRELPRPDIELIEGVAAQVGLAFENVELARQTEAKLRETNTLLAVSRAMSSTLDVDVLLRQFLGRIATVLDADGVGSYMLREGEWLVPLQGYRLPPERLAILRELRLSIVNHAFYAEGARTKRAVFSPDAMNDPRIPEVMRRAVPHKSELFVPIVAKGQVVGGLIAAWWDRVREFSEGELALIEAIASQAGVALENARLFQENRRRVEELSVLHALSRAITGELDRTALIDALHAELTRIFDGRNLLVMLRGDTENEATLALCVRDGVRDTDVPKRLTDDERGLAGVVMATATPLRTADHAAECAARGVGRLPDAPAARYWLGVPMIAANDALGVIALASAERRYSDSDERLLTNIAQLTALALRSARLFEERETAYSQVAAAQDQLVRTEKLRALGEMASGVAHDFNNVLAAILGRAQLLMSNLRDPRLRRWAEIIDQAAQDGAQTVRRLQEFTRIRRDQPVVAVDLNAIVRGALDMTQSRWGDEPASRNITLEVRTDLAPALPPIPGDPAELREALTNLILNAVDAMPGGGVLTLATRAPGEVIELTISDTGTGIPASVREKIFDPFFTTKGPRGTGLGLSMTYGIIVRHNGEITVDSEPGRGSTFRLTFPTHEMSPVPEAVDAAPAPVAAEALRCLVVDDEEPIAAVLADVLVSAGHTVVVFTDAAAAIAHAEVERFDVLFTDLAMPGMTGWQVARAIKAAQPHIAVLLMTGYGIELSAEERERHHIDAVLTKPVGVNTILEAVARITTTP